MRISTATFSHVQTDIRFLLPLEAGDRVCLFKGNPSLQQGLSDDGLIHVLAAEESGTVLPAAGMDHAVIATMPQRDFQSTLAEASRVLRPGGTLFLGILPPHRRTIRRMLRKSGFDVISIWGVRDNLSNPQYFIPLENAAASRYFFEQIHIPGSFRSEVFRRLSKVVTALGLHSYLYREFTILARKI